MIPKPSEERPKRWHNQYVASESVHKMILNGTEIERKSESLRQFIENSIRFSGLLQQRLGNIFQFPQQSVSRILKKSRTESAFVFESITKMGYWHKAGDLSPGWVGLEFVDGIRSVRHHPLTGKGTEGDQKCITVNQKLSKLVPNSNSDPDTYSGSQFNSNAHPYLNPNSTRMLLELEAKPQFSDENPVT